MMEKIAMSLMRISVLLLFTLAGMMLSCSYFPTKKDSDLQPYVDKFVDDMGFEPNDVKDYSVSFETLRKLDDKKGHMTVIGYCNPALKKVRIDPKFWYNRYETEKRRTALMHHELAHCVCLKPHDDMIMPDNCPVSIMNSSLPTNKCLQRHWEHYMEDLFQRCD